MRQIKIEYFFISLLNLIFNDIIIYNKILMFSIFIYILSIIIFYLYRIFHTIFYS